MGLTQVSTDGVKNDAITKTKIPANQIEASELADNAVDTNAIANNAVTAGKLASGVQTTINSNADNRVITGSGTANTLNGESNVQINSSGIMTIGNDASGAASLGGDLNVANTNGGTIIVGDTGSGEYLKLYGSGSGAYVGSKSNHPLIFFTNDTSNPAMRIDTSGRLKINHTDHPGQLDNTFISIHDTNGGGGISKNYAMMQVNNYGTGSPGDLSGIGFGAGAGNAYIKGSIGFMRTGGYGQGDFTFNLNTDNDTTLVNNTDELVRIQKGGGISFNGDTAADNALDDYEEGTFTPAYDAGGGVSFSYPQQYGFYTKIGDKVTFELYLQAHASNITSGNGGNSVSITGLPFAAHNHSRYYPAVTIGRTYFYQLNDNKRLYAYVQSGNSYIRLIQEQNDTGGSLFTAQQLDHNTCEILISGHYRV
nr:hypothetical protein [uncultured Mediterranean phage uvMED]